MITETDKLSIHYHTNTHGETELQTSMFMDDLCRNIVPSYGAKYTMVHCKLEPKNMKVEKLLIEMLPSDDFNHNDDLNEKILGVIQYMAEQIVHHGSLILEFVTQKDLSDKLIFSLDTIYGKEIKIKDNLVIQIVHDDAAIQLGITKPALIPMEKCFVIEFPESLGGKNNYLKFLNEFKNLAQKSPMLNYFGNPMAGMTGYNLSEHERLHKLELWRKSNLYNWNHRESSGEFISSFYSIYRNLQFMKVKIELRDYIIEKLQEIITIISEKIGNRIELKIEGLITAARIDEAIGQWKSGELKPGEIRDLL